MSSAKNRFKGSLNLLVFLVFLSNSTFATDIERDRRLARYEKNLAVAKAKCETEVPIIVQLNRGGSVTGVCLFLAVGYITMKIEKGHYSFSLDSDVADIAEATSPTNNASKTAPATEEQIWKFEIKRLESMHAIGIRFIDLNLLEDPLKFGKVAINYELRLGFVGIFLEGGADFKAGVGQNSKKYEGMAQLRWLFSKAFDTFYVGAFVNYQNGTTVQNDADSQKRDVEIKAYSLGPLMGKKWVFGSGVFLDLTLRAGPYLETILARSPNYKYELTDDSVGRLYRSALGGLALTFSLGFVF